MKDVYYEEKRKQYEKTRALILRLVKPRTANGRKLKAHQLVEVLKGSGVEEDRGAAVMWDMIAQGDLVLGDEFDICIGEKSCKG